MQFRPVVSPSPFIGSVTLVNYYICVFPLTGVGVTWMQFRPAVSPSPFTGSVTLVNYYICIYPLTGVGGNLDAV
ncbi:hypothetical protein DPMN_121689 [Dreissena polymorpha]|uniref:Uncharacterized protein n=1 Tax=Dreissena polymorpha TaxID=45954 RepID=A0A9D4GR61_DREPO|nr:hypothetical protein DPMN_121689 [Dreissena polymorpha]